MCLEGCGASTCQNHFKTLAVFTFGVPKFYTSILIATKGLHDWQQQQPLKQSYIDSSVMMRVLSGSYVYFLNRGIWVLFGLVFEWNILYRLRLSCDNVGLSAGIITTSGRMIGERLSSSGTRLNISSPVQSAYHGNKSSTESVPRSSTGGLKSVSRQSLLDIVSCRLGVGRNKQQQQHQVLSIRPWACVDGSMHLCSHELHYCCWDEQDAWLSNIPEYLFLACRALSPFISDDGVDPVSETLCI